MDESKVVEGVSNEFKGVKVFPIIIMEVDEASEGMEGGETVVG